MHFLIVLLTLLMVLTDGFYMASSAFKESRSFVSPIIKTKGRITNGNTAIQGQFPYQVGLSLKINSLSTAWCGGSLISKQWVLTAAHCTYSTQSVTVYLGATIRTSAELIYNVNKSDIVIHSEWNKNTLKNDISLIKIPAIVSYTKNIQAIKLPSVNSSNSNYVENYVIATGWGRISDTFSGVTNELQWARMQVTTNTECARIYGNTYISSSNLCVSPTEGSSTCSGDSGGPLVLESNAMQIGLISFGASAGCNLGYPIVFTRLNSYIDWIKFYTKISY